MLVTMFESTIGETAQISKIQIKDQKLASQIILVGRKGQQRVKKRHKRAEEIY